MDLWPIWLSGEGGLTRDYTYFIEPTALITDADLDTDLEASGPNLHAAAASGGPATTEYDPSCCKGSLESSGLYVTSLRMPP